MTVKHFLLWLPMIVIAFANATLRELLFVKTYSEFRAHQLSTITTHHSLRNIHLACGSVVEHSNIQARLFDWLYLVLLTVAFEFSLGRLTNKSWEFLFRDYNLFAGRIWLLFLFCLFIFPYLFYVLRNK